MPDTTSVAVWVWVWVLVSVWVSVSVWVLVSVTVGGSDVVVVSDVVVADVALVFVRVGDAVGVSEIVSDGEMGPVVLTGGTVERETDRLMEGSSLGKVTSPSQPTRPTVNAAHARRSGT